MPLALSSALCLALAGLLQQLSPFAPAVLQSNKGTWLALDVAL